MLIQNVHMNWYVHVVGVFQHWYHYFSLFHSRHKNIITGIKHRIHSLLPPSLPPSLLRFFSSNLSSLVLCDGIWTVLILVTWLLMSVMHCIDGLHQPNYKRY